MTYQEAEAQLNNFFAVLAHKEQSQNTIKKSKSDLRKFFCYAAENNFYEIQKEDLMRYKEYLISEKFEKNSINSYITTINKFLKFLNLQDCRVKPLRVQNNMAVENIIELTEYKKLIEHLKSTCSITTYLLIRAIATSGIRVGELQFLTVETLKNGGKMEVTNKNKTRMVLFPDEIIGELSHYCQEKEIISGPIFRNKKTNTPLHPTSIWRRIKTAAKQADVDDSKAFPHNLRHLFAKVYLECHGNIFDLADLLGHENINTTRIYNRKTSEEKRMKINEMSL